MQDVGKDVAECALCVVGRCLVGRADGELWFGQSLHVGLPVGCHGHLFQLQVGGGYHVLGQTLGDFCLQRIGGNLPVGCIISTEMLLAVEFADEDDHFFHALHLKHHILYFTEFDAQSAEFDLMVGSS